MNGDFPIGTLVLISGSKPDELGIIVGHHHVRVWPSEETTINKYKVIYKINIISRNTYKYCYSYEMVILSD